MTKLQKTWYNWGISDAKAYPNDHPERLLQEAWNLFLTDIEAGAIDLYILVQLFPFYRKGIFKIIKQ